MDKTIIRLKKVAGQINALVKMFERDEDCEKIIIQFQAAKAALDSAFSESLETTLKQCLKEKDQKNINNILRLLAKK